MLGHTSSLKEHIKNSINSLLARKENKSVLVTDKPLNMISPRYGLNTQNYLRYENNQYNGTNSTSGSHSAYKISLPALIILYGLISLFLVTIICMVSYDAFKDNREAITRFFNDYFKLPIYLTYQFFRSSVENIFGIKRTLIMKEDRRSDEESSIEMSKACSKSIKELHECLHCGRLSDNSTYLLHALVENKCIVM